jgi:hypothetical protein
MRCQDQAGLLVVAAARLGNRVEGIGDDVLFTNIKLITRDKGNGTYKTSRHRRSSRGTGGMITSLEVIE